MPSPQELMDMPLSWEADMHQMHRLYRYVKDYPAFMQQFAGGKQR